MDKIVKEYIKELKELESIGTATEISYYYPLQTLLKKIAKKYSKNHKDIIVIPEAKAQWFGRPDFTILNNENKLIGIIEAKIPGTNLIKMEKTTQIKSYLEQIPNFIFTNFYEFKLYDKNKIIKSLTINDNDIIKLLTTFLSKTIPKNYNVIKLTKKQKEKQKKYGYVDIQRYGKTIRILKLPKKKPKPKREYIDNDNEYMIMGSMLTKKERAFLKTNGWVDITRNSKNYEVTN